MKKILSAALLPLFVVLMAVPDAEAQIFYKRNRYATVGLTLNGMNHWGDIVPRPSITSFRFRSTRPHIGVNYTYKFFPRVYGRAALSWGRITGEDSKSASPQGENVYRNIRNLSFRNDIKELSFVGMVDLYENRRTYPRRPERNWYAFAGISVFHHNPMTYWEGDARMAAGWYALQPLGTEGQNISGQGYRRPYARMQVAIPFGFGFKYKLDRRWDIGVELGIRKTFTDYLDDVSTNYAAKSDLMGDSDSGLPAALLSDRSVQSGTFGPRNLQTEVINGVRFQNVNGWGRRGDQRGDPTRKDWFFTTGINVSYILRPNMRSPRFR